MSSLPGQWWLGLAAVLLAMLPPSPRVPHPATPPLLVLAWQRSWLAWFGFAWLLLWQRRKLSLGQLGLASAMLISAAGYLPLGVLLEVVLGLWLSSGRGWVSSLSVASFSLLLASLLQRAELLLATLTLLGLSWAQTRTAPLPLPLREMLQDSQLALEAAAELQQVTMRSQQQANLARQFVAQEDYLGTLQQLLDLADKILPSQCLAILVKDEQDRLLPLLQRGAPGNPLEACLLQGLREPVADECWQHRQPVLRFQPAQGDRMFPVAGAALALPLADQGVLFLAGPHQTVDELQRQQLVQLTSVAGEAIARADRQRQKALALEQAQRAAHRLSSRLNLVETLLQGVLSITESLDPERILGAAAEAAQRLVEGSRVVLRRGDQLTLSSAIRQAPESSLLARLQSLAGQGVIVRELPDLGATEVALVPLPDQGMLLSLCDRQGAFAADHLAMFKLIAASLGLALENARLHQTLLQTSKMLAVGQLAAGVAHEINNPLMAISMQTDLLRSFVQDGEITPSLDQIAAAVERCRQISYGLLAFARGGSVSRKPVCLADTLQRALRFLTLQAPVHIRIDPQLCVLAGEAELVQVLVNLLQNADQAMQEADTSQPQIWVEALPVGDQVSLLVRDCGPGMSESLRQRIFEPFFTTREVGSGTGLGLYLVFNLVSSLGGRIEVDSREGEGSSFRIWLALPPTSTN